MATKLKNIANLFNDLKSRTIIIVTLMIIIFGLLIGFFHYQRTAGGPQASSLMEGIPQGIRAIPGKPEQNIEYAKLQAKENQEKVERAFQKGTSAIPTIIHTNLNKDDNTKSQEPENLRALALAAVKQSGCSIEAIQNARQAGVSAAELRQLGCAPDQLKVAGFSATDLLKAGFSPEDLRRLGFSLDALRNAGVCSCDLKHAGYTAVQLKQAGYTAQELKCACFTDEELAQAGFPPAATLAAMTTAINSGSCDPESLAKARAQGATSVELRHLGCSAAQLQQAGFSASELKAAGFSAEELKAAGFSAGELIAAGFTPDPLKKAGFSAQELRAAGVSAAELKAAGVSPAELKAAGFTAAELSKAGFTPEQLTQAGYTADALRDAGIGAKQGEAKVYDCSIASLAKAKQEGISAAEIRKTSGCDTTALKAAGYDAQELKDAGFTAGELKRAGFSSEALKKAGFSAVDLKKAGFTPEELRKAGFTANELRQAGFSVGALKNAGFSATELKDAGFNAGELRRAGFAAEQLKQAGFTARELKDAGYNLQDLKNAGFDPVELKQAGFDAKQLKAVGIDAKTLRNAGFSNQELQDAGFAPADLVQAGIAAAMSGAPGTSITPASDTTLVSVPGTTDFPASSDVVALAAQQQQQYTEQQLKQAQQEVMSAMQGQAQQLFGKWTAINTQAFVVGEQNEETTGVSGSGQGVGANAAGQSNADTGPVLIKAGSILFAVLDTAVNSDEPGPIMATVVEGKFKGGKLLGTLVPFGQFGEKVLLSFNKLILPHVLKSISVDVVAIDPNTARTALSSYTDHHYLLRYGSLFASSFLQGYGQAIAQSGSLEINRADGSSIKQNKELSSRQLAAAGLGQVGVTWGSQLGTIFNRPYTVHVFAGTSVGLLIREDVQSPSK